ncbi:MAG: hypothetical protein WCK63_16485 [Betaproteobacteria bacterium]
MAAAAINVARYTGGFLEDAIDQLNVGFVDGQGRRFAVLLLRFGHVGRVLALKVHGRERSIEVTQERRDLGRRAINLLEFGQHGFADTRVAELFHPAADGDVVGALLLSI